MRRYLMVLCVFLFLVVSAAGCSNNAGNERNDTETETSEAGIEAESEINEVDVDLTSMSQVLIEAQFENIISNSEDFIGKTIRVIGTYFPLYMAEYDTTYHYVIIVYGDDCCQLGFEFRLDGDHVGPDDYPDLNEMIEVTGVLGRYEEYGTSYLYLAVKELIFTNR